MSNRSSAENPRIIKRTEKEMLEQKVISLQAVASARAAELAKLEKETKDLSKKNAELKERYQAVVNELLLQDSRNEYVKLEIQWLKMKTSNPAMHFPFSPAHAADPLPNPQGHEHSAEASPGLAGASSSAAGGNDALPRYSGGIDHSLDDPSGNNSLAEDGGKPADPAPTG